MFTKSAGILLDGLNAAGDYIDLDAVLNLAAGGLPGYPTVPVGLPVLRSIAAIPSVGTQGSVATNPFAILAGGGNTAQNPLPQPDLVLLQNAVAVAAAGDIFGCFQGPASSGLAGQPGSPIGANVNAAPPGISSGGGGPIFGVVGGTNALVRLVCRKAGIGWALCGVINGGTTFTSGTNAAIIAPATTAQLHLTSVAKASRALGLSGGLVTAYPLNTTTLGPATAGSSSIVPVAGQGVGLPANGSLVIDAGTPLQETVTTSAGANQVLASTTITLSGTPVNGTAVLTINGVVITVPLLSGDTATTGAVKIVAGINASAAVLGLSGVLQAATNAAGVITVAQNMTLSAAQANAITVVVTSITSTWTLVAAAATLTGGTNATVTFTPVNAHSTGATLQGVVNGLLISAPATAGLYFAAPLLVDLNCWA